jgi:methylase of polypeptide subunit release factors
MPSLRSVIQETHRTLESAGIPDSRLEAEVMVMDVMRMPRQAIFAEQETLVSEQQRASLDEIVRRRLTREPLAYILNYGQLGRADPQARNGNYGRTRPIHGIDGHGES